MKKIKSSSTAKFDNIDNISLLEGEATDGKIKLLVLNTFLFILIDVVLLCLSLEDDHESKASSISITMSNNEKENNDHYTKTANGKI